MPDWNTARSAMMLDPEVMNLNTGSWGPTPRAVFDRVTELRRQQAAGPMDFMLRATPPLLWNARTKLSEFLGTDARRLIFTQNVSTAINIVASGLSLKGPGEILMSDREYGSMEWCWERAAKRQGLTIRKFPLNLTADSSEQIVDDVSSAITPQTRLLFFSQVYSANGMVLPAKELCELARQRGIISVVDGAHAPAQIALDVDEVGADFYAANLHKWLLAPIGAGFLALGKNSLDRLEPLQVSWGYRNAETAKMDEPDEFGSTPRLRHLEFEGTRDICPWFVVPDAIDFQSALGWDAIRQRMAELSDVVRERLSGVASLRLATPTHIGMRGAMTAFWIDSKVPADEIRKRIWDHRIEVPIMEWPDGRTLRVSTYFYNTEGEIDRFVEILPSVLR